VRSDASHLLQRLETLVANLPMDRVVVRLADGAQLEVGRSEPGEAERHRTSPGI
jgi:hypothetical protein